MPQELNELMRSISGRNNAIRQVSVEGSVSDIVNAATDASETGGTGNRTSGGTGGFGVTEPELGPANGGSDTVGEPSETV